MNVEKIEELQEALTVQETINLLTKSDKEEIIEKVYNDIITSKISNDELIVKYNLVYLRTNCTLEDILSFNDIGIIRSLLISRLSELSVDLYYVIPSILALEYSLIGNAKMLLKTLSENYNIDNITEDIYKILEELPDNKKQHIEY